MILRFIIILDGDEITAVVAFFLLLLLCSSVQIKEAFGNRGYLPFSQNNPEILVESQMEQ